MLPQPILPQPILPQPMLPQSMLPQPRYISAPMQPLRPLFIPQQPIAPMPPQPMLPQPMLPQPMPPWNCACCMACICMARCCMARCCMACCCMACCCMACCCMACCLIWPRAVVSSASISSSANACAPPSGAPIASGAPPSAAPPCVSSPCVSSMKAASASLSCRFGTISSTLTPVAPQSAHVAPTASPEASSTSAWAMRSFETEQPQHGSTTGSRKSAFEIGHRNSSGTSVGSIRTPDFFVSLLNDLSSTSILSTVPSAERKPPAGPSPSPPTDLRKAVGIPTGSRRRCGASRTLPSFVGQNWIKWPGWLQRRQTYPGGGVRLAAGSPWGPPPPPPAS